MSRLTVQSAHEIIEHNRKRIYHMPARYEYIGKYLQGNTRKTLLQIYLYLVDKEIIIDHHRYMFVMDNARLTTQIRKQPYSGSSTARYMSMLCALGFFRKIPQGSESNQRLRINEERSKAQPGARDINAYSFRRYTDKELDRIEGRAKRLYDAGVKLGNISYNMLMLNSCEDIAAEVFPNNLRRSPNVKAREYAVMKQCIDMLIESQGYATREQIRDNLISEMSNQEIDRLLRIYKLQLQQSYNFKRPTQQQKEEYGLQSNKFIYTARE